MAHCQAKLFEVILTEVRKRTAVDGVVGECLRVLTEPKPVQPPRHIVRH